MSDSFLGAVAILATLVSGALGFFITVIPAFTSTSRRKAWTCLVFVIAVVAGATATFWQVERTAKEQGRSEQKLTDMRQAVTDTNTKLTDANAKLTDANTKLSELRGQVNLVLEADTNLNTKSSTENALLQVLAKNVSVAATPIPPKPTPIDSKTELMERTGAMSNKELDQAAQALSANIFQAFQRCDGLLDEINGLKLSLASARDEAARERTNNNIRQMEKLLTAFLAGNRANYRSQVGILSMEILNRIDVTGKVQDPMTIPTTGPTNCVYLEQLRRSLDDLSVKLPNK